ncbi:hypothetical protein QCA50_000923 [Cerrena zonata]|uniref:Tat pathway signal sequence n=1 Tax=Cerrena zonata TaxID=2478898 RepID=A0AAW0GSS2_9APHY
MSSDTEYVALLDKELDEEDDRLSPPHRSRSRISWITVWACLGFLQTLAVIVLSAVVYTQNRKSPYSSLGITSQMIYSPAQDVLEHQVQKFSNGINSTIYQGAPSTEVDKAWKDLYNGMMKFQLSGCELQDSPYRALEFGISQIPKSQARLLPNHTSPIPGNEENYVIALSVFHQLHCLNVLRKAHYHEYYRDPVTGNIDNISPQDLNDHVSHCLDSIRQSLMCSSDISVIVWQWSTKQNLSLPRMDTARSCRNFDKIADWARDHRSVHFDSSVRMEDDIVIPEF